MDHRHNHRVRTAIATAFFFILINLPPSHCEEDNEYRMCSRPDYCGEMDIYYPFWGEPNRPQYCGGGDPFKLNCSHDGTTSIQIGTRGFSVQDINPFTYTMTMKPKPDDLAYEGYEPAYCSQDFVVITLDPTPFRYTERVHNISIFMNCPSGVSNGINAFTCSNHDTKHNFYVDVQDINKFPQHKDCKRSIQVQSLHRVPPGPGGGIEPLNEAWNGGFEVNYTVANAQQCKQCMDSKGACGVNVTTHQFTCYCQDGSHALNCSTSKSNHWNWQRTAIIGLASATIVGLLICMTILYSTWKPSTWHGKFCMTIFCSICKPSTWRGKFWLMTKSNQDIEAFLKSCGALTLKRYKFSDVKKMTNSFKVKLGQGGFGVVYKGKLLSNSPVAVKILKSSKGDGEEFINEVASISRTSHVNIVTLLGFCLEGHKKALIYEFMPNGSLDNFIYKKGQETIASLSLENLYQIAIGIARGLEYLHRGCNTRIFHFDIKPHNIPHNILLDENFCPKISDFGLAKLCPRNKSIVSMSDPRGTYGYLAPEMWNRRFGGVSHKSDVYSYGMILLDMVEGRKNTSVEASRSTETYFPDWIYNRLQQRNLRPDGMTTIEENEIVRRMTIVALWCIQTCPNDRPTMSRVIDMLEGSQNSLEIPPKPILSSPTRSIQECSTS